MTNDIIAQALASLRNRASDHKAYAACVEKALRSRLDLEAEDWRSEICQPYPDVDEAHGVLSAAGLPDDFTGRLVDDVTEAYDWIMDEIDARIETLGIVGFGLSTEEANAILARAGFGTMTVDNRTYDRFEVKEAILCIAINILSRGSEEERPSHVVALMTMTDSDALPFYLKLAPLSMGLVGVKERPEKVRD